MDSSSGSKTELCRAQADCLGEPLRAPPAPLRAGKTRGVVARAETVGNGCRALGHSSAFGLDRACASAWGELGGSSRAVRTGGLRVHLVITRVDPIERRRQGKSLRYGLRLTGQRGRMAALPNKNGGRLWARGLSPCSWSWRTRGGPGGFSGVLSRVPKESQSAP